MIDFKEPTSNAKNGTAYKIPKGLDENDFYNMIYEFIDFAKIKGLTVRQAQFLFDSCKDYLLDNKLV